MVTEAALRRTAKEFLGKLGERSAALDIFLLPHREIKALKAQFFKKQTEPNVLAFPEPRSFPHPEFGKGKQVKKKRYLGEIYLNQDILSRAPERTRPLLVHGILHLLGYDHKKDGDAVRMEALEAKILGRK